jgi:hypothetical protein
MFEGWEVLLVGSLPCLQYFELFILRLGESAPCVALMQKQVLQQGEINALFLDWMHTK